MECEYLDRSKEPCVSYQVGGMCNRRDMFRCVEYMKANEPTMSYSALRDYVTCPRKYYYSVIRGLQLLNPPVRLMAGKIMSECLDQIHASSPTSKYTEILNKYKEQYSDPKADPEKVYNLELCRIEGFLRAYVLMPVSEEKGITQYEFRWKKREGYPVIHGYMDLARDLDGEGGYGYEFKYSGNDNWGKFVVAGQLGTYFLGTNLERITLRILKVPGIKPKRGEKTDEYIDRVQEEVSGSSKEYVRDFSYWRNEFDLDALADKYKMLANEIYERLRVGERAFYLTENQDAHFRCDYLNICESGVISEQLYTKREGR